MLAREGRCSALEAGSQIPAPLPFEGSLLPRGDCAPRQGVCQDR